MRRDGIDRAQSSPLLSLQQLSPQLLQLRDLLLSLVNDRIYDLYTANWLSTRQRRWKH